MRTVLRGATNPAIRLLLAISALAVASGPAFAGSPSVGADGRAVALARKDARSKRPKPPLAEPQSAAPAAPADDGAGALSSCKKHVENMLKSPATQFQSDGSIRIVQLGAETFDVSGPVRSTNASGEAIGGSFACRAQRIGGAVWATRTSLDFAR
jgi:hypothetical protein